MFLKLFLTALWAVASSLAVGTKHHNVEPGAALAVLSRWTEEFANKHRISQACHVVVLGLEEEMVQQIVVGSGLDAPFVLYSEGSISNKTAFETRSLLYSSARCVVALAIAGSDYVHWMNKALRVVHHRRAIFVSKSARETRKLPTGDITFPSVIVETHRCQNESFWIHSVCPNCYFVLMRRQDLWRPGRGLIKKSSNYLEGCCFGHTELYGKTVGVSLFGPRPYIIVDRSKPVPISGVDFDILVILAQRLKFMPKIVGENSWGEKLKNGTWIGIIGKVQRRQSLLGLGAVSVTHDKFQVVDFSFSTYMTDYAFATNLPKPLKPFSNVVNPFEYRVWVFTVICTCLVATAWFFFYYVESYPNPKSTKKQTSHLISYFLLAVSMLVNQDAGKHFRGVKMSSMTILYLIWTVGTSLLVMAYLSNFEASLIAVAYEKPIETIQQLVDQDANIYQPYSSLVAKLPYSSSKSRRELYALVERKKTFIDPMEKEIEKKMSVWVKESGKGGALVGVHQFKSNAKMFVETFGSIPFQLVKERLFVLQIGIAVPKHCLFLDQINKVIVGLVESGIVNRLFEKTYPPGYNQDSKSEQAERALDLDTYISSLIFLGCMLAVATAAWVREMVKTSKGQTNKNVGNTRPAWDKSEWDHHLRWGSTK